MAISEDEVLHLAKLSRINFSQDKIHDIAEHLGHMLEHFEKLDSVDTSSVPATAHILPFVNVLREDIAMPSELTREELLANAPAQDGGCFVVPKVVE